MTYSLRRIVDWDFRHCPIDDPEYDPDADRFSSASLIAIRAMSRLRLRLAAALVREGLAQVEPAGEHIRLGNGGDRALRRRRHAFGRWTPEGRLERRVAEALRREHRKRGRIRLEILPSSPHES